MNRSAVRPGPVQVAAGHAGAAEVQLADDPDRDRVQVLVEHVGPVVGDREADRRRQRHGRVQLWHDAITVASVGP